MEEKKEESFTVRDRRMFSSGGEAKAEETQRERQKPAEEAVKGSAEEKKPAEEEAAGSLPEPDFSAFVLSIAASAQVGLGMAPNPQTSMTARNLPAAKQMIDIIAMLREKTKGNLTADEAALVDEVLYGLRMLYVRAMESRV